MLSTPTLQRRDVQALIGGLVFSLGFTALIRRRGTAEKTTAVPPLADAEAA